jgi:hypothetical protein
VVINEFSRAIGSVCPSRRESILKGGALNYGDESVGADPQPSGKQEVDIRDEQMWVSGIIGASSS